VTEINRVDGGGLEHEGGENGCPLTAALFNTVCNCYDSQDIYSLASRDLLLQRRGPILEGLKCIFNFVPDELGLQRCNAAGHAHA
jgi:hypothetical protein